MKRQILVLLAAAALATGCYRDNASPFVHGAKNKPGDVTSGKTSTPGELSTAQNTDTAAAARASNGSATSPAAAPSDATATTTYGQSGGQAGGVQAPKP